MEWTEEKDVFMLREMLCFNVFAHKKGSSARGLAWEAIVSTVNGLESQEFQLKDKRAVRKRWMSLRKKFTKKIREEENASGIAVNDLTEKEALIEELVSREDTATASEAETASKQHEKETAENMRKKAMETLGETNKRKSKSKDGSTDKRGKSGRCTKPLVDFLREKPEADREIRQQELEIRKQEQQSQQQVFQTLSQKPAADDPCYGSENSRR